MKPSIDYTLYLVTDRELMRAPTLESAVEQAIAGGASVVQIREKTLSSLDFFEQAERLKKVTDASHVPLIVNDRVDIALAVDAAGVHVGQSDLPAPVVRRMIGPDKILGVSVSTVAEALQAERDGADYLGVGTLFPTATKQDGMRVSLETLREISIASPLPLVVIGGITLHTLPLLQGVRVDGAAVVSAVIAQDQITPAAQNFKKSVLHFCSHRTESKM